MLILTVTGNPGGVSNTAVPIFPRLWLFTKNINLSQDRTPPVFLTFLKKKRSALAFYLFCRGRRVRVYSLEVA